MKIKKNIYISLVIIAACVGLLSITGLKTFYAFMFTEEALKESVHNLFKVQLNRAVKFERIDVSLCGDIVVTSFNLSTESDFNDNISLVEAPKITVDLNFYDLLNGVITVSGITIPDAKIMVFKSFGKDYNDITAQFKDIYQRLNRIAQKHERVFELSFSNCSLIYQEIFSEDEVLISLNEIDASLKFVSKIINYTISINSVPNKNSDVSDGHMELKGEYYFDDAGYIKQKVVIENCDLSYLNRFIGQKKISDISLKGSVSTDVEIKYINNILTVAGIIETNNLHVFSLKPQQHPVISNENINIEGDIQINRGLGKYTIRHLNIFDDILNITLKGEYVHNENDHTIDATVQSNSIDLTELSHYFSPLRNIYYSGNVMFSGDFKYDILNNVTAKSFFALALDDFHMIDIGENSKTDIISKGKASFRLKDNKIDSLFEGYAYNSDFRCTMSSSISSWLPLQSSSEVAVYSKKTDVALFTRIYSQVIDKVVSAAYRDAEKGYEEVFFLQKPLGTFLINNDFTFDYNIDTLEVNPGKDKNGFKDFAFSIVMNKGVLTLRDFHLWGYDAAYDFDLQGYFYRDYPHITFNGSVKNFDLGKLSRETEFASNISGLLSGDFSYELNIYRMSHFLQNSRATLRVHVADGTIGSGVILDTVQKFYTDNNYTIQTVQYDTFDSLDLVTQQYGETIYLRNFNYRGDNARVNLYGKYSYRDGLNLSGGSTVNIVTTKDEKEHVSKKYVPLAITGSLSGPCIDVKNKKESSRVCF